ncbi:MAG: DUF4912 domain-containing protein [Planctomycetota bacterium]|nr:MAG: DUF4912 domain-containing protein [Planctomycetota bacterium]
MSKLENLNLKQLKDLARELEIPNRSRMRKAELILALYDAQGSSDSGDTSSSSSAGKDLAHQATSLQASSSGGSSSGGTNSDTQPFGPHGDPGLPIPQHYGRDSVVLMVQDPEHLYVWWELSSGTTEQLRQRLGQSSSSLLLLYGPDGCEQRVIDLAAGNYYLAVAPKTTYRVALALRDSNGTLHLLAQSEEVQTPAASPSDAIDEEWMAVDETFATLLQQAQGEGNTLSSAERLREQRRWAQQFPHPLSSKDLLGLPSSFALSSTALSSRSLQ